VFDEAGARYGVSPALLRAIARQESGGNWRAINHNRNGTVDYCAMQIQQCPPAETGGLWHRRDRLLDDPALCASVGAFLLAREASKVGMTWEAVAHYHTGGASTNTPAKLAYASRFKGFLAARPRAPAGRWRPGSGKGWRGEGHTYRRTEGGHEAGTSNVIHPIS
jgi:soluble lytic murein transglycosylase-like protein